MVLINCESQFCDVLESKFFFKTIKKTHHLPAQVRINYTPLLFNSLKKLLQIKSSNLEQLASSSNRNSISFLAYIKLRSL